jgi:hypothetical protein
VIADEKTTMGSGKINRSMTLAVLLIYLSAPLANAQQCPAPDRCREEIGHGGGLLHKPNKNGHSVWTVPCGGNGDSRRHHDVICEEIASCEQAGAFGKFLKAVTFNCQIKHFDGYFGLDGLTYGILDFTASSVPGMLKAYQARNPKRFDEIFGPLGLPIKEGCVDANWVCEQNKQAKFMCDPNIRAAFQSSVVEPDFQKAQVDVALREYERRLNRYTPLGLKTEYANTVLAVLANNLVSSPECRPETWKKICSKHQNETKIVDCMLDEYVAHACRGTAGGSKERRDAIKAVIASVKPSTVIHPTADDVVACTTKWGASGPEKK